MSDYDQPEPAGVSAYPIARAGYPFIFAAAFSTAVFALIDFSVLAVIGLVVTLCICGFFRDPDRVIPNRSGAVVSPADGKVIIAGPADNTPYFEGPCQQVSIFMSVFNVHVNRIPCAGTVRNIGYRPGRFFAAHRRKASLENEQNAVYIQTGENRSITVVQVAGLIARRIICRVQPDDRVQRGQRFGMICFGSRLDVYLPRDVSLQVAVGDKIQAGTTIIAQLPPATT
jgi:phosphatidylserine decarboxylase